MPEQGSLSSTIDSVLQPQDFHLYEDACIDTLDSWSGINHDCESKIIKDTGGCFLGST